MLFRSDFLIDNLIPRCQNDKSFSIEHMISLMKLDCDDLITTTDIKSLDGKTAKKVVKRFFNDNFLQDVPSTSDEYEF